jgi:hypothetical protein
MTFVAGLLPQSVMPVDVKFVRNILSVMVSQRTFVADRGNRAIRAIECRK